MSGADALPWTAAPRVPGRLPWIGPGLALLNDPTAWFQRQRDRFGDTYVFETFGYRVFNVFSPVGVKNLWALPEAEASKGVGDFALLSHKVPAELFDGRRTFPHGLFARENVEVYLANLGDAVDLELAGLGTTGEFEAFAFTRRLSHRMGLASWGSPLATRAGRLERLIPAFDALDSSESFVHPSKGFLTWATGKRREKAALAEIESIYREILAERDAQKEAERQEGFFSDLCANWAGEPPDVRATGIARDVMLVHMGSQSNLFAAMAWTLVHLLERPALLARVREGDEGLLERCAHESIRLRQRSIVLRRILRPCVIEDESHAYGLEPGLFLATMMSVTNVRGVAGLDRFDPEHYAGGPRFARQRELPASELVTTFGHGAHYCPAARFSTRAICLATRALVDRFALEPRFRDPQPRRRQIGGVSRADRPCRIRYAARA
ncbi:MAG: cytochrome P450 [Myxococcota bacterium]